jgi:hypothetical protein
MRALVPIIAAAILSSCSYPPTPPGVALARETAGLVAGPPQSCISSMPDQGLRIVDEQTLAYGWGRSVAVNHMSGPCPGLHPASTLIVEPGLAGQYCRGDRVRVLETGSMIPGAVCILGDWTPYRRP